jgi:membrane-associated phospholipid phosphatase
MSGTLFKVISYLFHPLLMLTYAALLVFWANPYLFQAQSGKALQVHFLSLFFTTFLLPAVAIVMMKSLGLIKSIHMQDRQDRIGPLIVTGVFYIWAFRNMISNPDIPQPLTIFTLGICIVLGLCFLINLFSKISLHAAGAGGMIVIAALIWQFFAPYGFAIGSWIMDSSIIVALILIFAGLTGSARLYLKAHNPSEIMGGYFIGIAGQLIAFFILYRF